VALGNCEYGCGTIFSVTSSGVEHVIHSFDDNKRDGYGSGFVALRYANGWLYCTTGAGGAHQNGTVFAITPAGKERIVYSFESSPTTNGYAPRGGVIFLRHTLFGTTVYGGKGAGGTVYAITNVF